VNHMHVYGNVSKLMKRYFPTKFDHKHIDNVDEGHCKISGKCVDLPSRDLTILFNLICRSTDLHNLENHALDRLQ